MMISCYLFQLKHNIQLIVGNTHNINIMRTWYYNMKSENVKMQNK